MDNGNGELIQGKGTGTGEGKEGQIVRGGRGFDDGAERGFGVDLALLDPVKTGWFFDKTDWLTAKEAAIYLRKFRPNGNPSLGAIYMMLERGQLRKRKFFGRLYFSRRELERALESANSI